MNMLVAMPSNLQQEHLHILQHEGNSPVQVLMLIVDQGSYSKNENATREIKVLHFEEEDEGYLLIEKEKTILKII